MAEDRDRSSIDETAEIGRATEEDVKSSSDGSDDDEFEDTEDLDEPEDFEK